MGSISTSSLSALPFESVGWIAGYAILRTRLERPFAPSQPCPSIYHFVRQAEPSMADRDWKIEVEPMHRTPSGVIAILRAIKKGAGFFGKGADGYTTLIHLDGDKILGANAGDISISSSETGVSRGLADALDEMDSQSLQNLARMALTRSKALDTMQTAQYAAESSLESLKASLEESSAP